jgi:hypothetical protein
LVHVSQAALDAAMLRVCSKPGKGCRERVAQRAEGQTCVP